jgi:methionine aminotransferase
VRNANRHPVKFASKLPEVGTTIFSVMTELAQRHNAINLAQGFPDYAADPQLLEFATEAMRSGYNQYAPMPGVPSLRSAVSESYAVRGLPVDPDVEITITPGATAALYTAFAAFVHPDDEVIVLTPAYDSYAPAIRSVGGRVVAVPLTESTFRPDWEALYATVSAKTRMIVINTPHNPTGTVWGIEDLAELARFVDTYNLLVVSDEVYDKMTYDDVVHRSPFELPALRNRTIVVTSFGKTLHVTGWKVGCVVAADYLMQEIRKVHQFLAFSVHTPAQHAISKALGTPNLENVLRRFFQAKRDVLRCALRDTSLELMPCQGTYFQLVRYTVDVDDISMAERCTIEHGVATIPLSPFMVSSSWKVSPRYLRLCFAKRDDTLHQAAERLVQAFPRVS